MADRFIDQDETKIYGRYAEDKIKKRAVGIIAAFDAALLYLADEIDKATTAVEEAVIDARDADAEIRKGTVVRGSALKDGIAVLGRFSKHLDTHPAGTIDRKVFFTADGTAGGVGKSVAHVLNALQHIARKLKKDKDTPVKSAADWAKEHAAAAARLAPIMEHADNAKTDRRSVTAEVEAARQAWLNTYGAAKLCVGSVLKLTGKMHLMPRIFFDLAVPATAKVTAPPEEEPDDDEEEDAGNAGDGATQPGTTPS